MTLEKMNILLKLFQWGDDMKLNDIVKRTIGCQAMTIEVMMQDDLSDGTTEKYSMTWKGCAMDVPSYIRQTDVSTICSNDNGIYIMTKE